MRFTRSISRMAFAVFILPLLLTGASRAQGPSFSIASININSAGTLLIVVVNATNPTAFTMLSQASTASNITVPSSFTYPGGTMPATTFALSPVMLMVGMTSQPKIQYAKNRSQAWLFYSISSGSTLPAAVSYAATQAGNQVVVNLNLMNSSGGATTNYPTTTCADGDIIIIDPCPPTPSQPHPPSKTLPVVYYPVQHVYYVRPTWPACGCSPAP